MSKTIEYKPLQLHKIVSDKEWLRARKKFLAKEKKFTRLRDQLSQERRNLPWVEIKKNYVLEGPGGNKKFSDLFGKRNQLIVYHFMFAPGWDEGCPACSFWADNFNGVTTHLNHRDASLVAISRAPVKKIKAFQKRMKWSFPWLSSEKSDFNFDLGVSFRPDILKKKMSAYNFGTSQPYLSDREGISIFYKDKRGRIFRTYSTYARGLDMMNTAYHYMDLLPKGRDEKRLSSNMDWLRHHDKYKN